MSKFKLENIDKGSGSERWVTYYDPDTNDRFFIARFKYFSPGRCATHFVKFLVKNFTIEEYKELMATRLSPIEALATKGYISYHTEKQMKEAGFPLTAEGQAEYRIFSTQQMMKDA